MAKSAPRGRPARRPRLVPDAHLIPTPDPTGIARVSADPSSRSGVVRRIRARPLPLLVPAAAAAALFMLAPGVAGPPRAAGAEVLNRVVLRVNDQIATLFEYDRRRAEFMSEIRRRVTDPSERRQELAQAGEDVFRNLFQELLLTSRADQLGIEATDQEVDQEMATMRENLGIKTDEEFQEALRQGNLTVEQLRAQTRRNVRIRQVMGKEVSSKIKVKDDDLRRYYRKNQDKFKVPEQIQLREVVVLDDSGLPEAERSEVAAEIRNAVAAGKSLADAAAPFAAKKQASGVVELGWVSPKDLDPKLEAAAWKLPKAGLTETVAARGGLHLLQLIDRHPAHLRPFAEVQAEIQQQEQERIYREESAKYFSDLESKSLVVADPPPEAANFRRKLGVAEDESMKGLAGAGTSPTAGNAAAVPAAGDLKETRPSPVDTSDRKKGGLPAAQPVGAPPREPVTIPPPSNVPPPPAPPPPPAATPPPPPGATPPGR
jgi:peptidyl-prolyl cis-trans isomerase C